MWLHMLKSKIHRVRVTELALERAARLAERDDR